MTYYKDQVQVRDGTQFGTGTEVKRGTKYALYVQEHASGKIHPPLSVNVSVHTFTLCTDCSLVCVAASSLPTTDYILILIQMDVNRTEKNKQNNLFVKDWLLL